MGGTLDPEEFKEHLRERARKIFHRLWGTAKGNDKYTSDYHKHDWQELQTILAELGVHL